MKVEYVFDPFEIAGIDDNLSKREKSKVLEEIAAYVHESVLSYIGDSKSPVSGRKFPLLDKEYAKKEHGGNRVSHLELDGDLLDSIKVNKKGNELILTVSKGQQKKADGHNNFSGKSKLPLRQFVPNGEKKETFVNEIKIGIKSIIKDAIES